MLTMALPRPLGFAGLVLYASGASFAFGGHELEAGQMVRGGLTAITQLLLEVFAQRLVRCGWRGF